MCTDVQQVFGQSIFKVKSEAAVSERITIIERERMFIKRYDYIYSLEVFFVSHSSIINLICLPVERLFFLASTFMLWYKGLLMI